MQHAIWHWSSRHAWALQISGRVCSWHSVWHITKWTLPGLQSRYNWSNSCYRIHCYFRYECPTFEWIQETWPVACWRNVDRIITPVVCQQYSPLIIIQSIMRKTITCICRKTQSCTLDDGVISVSTHWPQSDVKVLLKVWYPHTYYGLNSWAPLGNWSKCHSKRLIISQYYSG